VDQPADLELVNAIAARYLPAEEVEKFLQENNTPDSVTIRMRPETWLSADYGKAG
jgi:hypothetical protein